MDEPFGALDEIVRDRLNEQLLGLWRRTGKTIGFVTHSIPEAVYLSTRIVVMSPAARADHRCDRIARCRASGRWISATAPSSSPSPIGCARGCGRGMAMRSDFPLTPALP